MKITKSGFYKISELTPITSELKKEAGRWIIDISNNIAITLFDDTNNSIDINIGDNSNVEFYGLFYSTLQNNTKKVNIIQKQNNSTVHFRYLIFSNINEERKIKILSNISGENNSCDVKILSIIGENGNINLDGIIKIEKKSKGIKARLIEDNLFLGNKGKIKGIPTLLVESDDVEASHACKIEKISNDKLFYMRSRGVGKENAISMIIDAKIFDLFKCLSMINKDFYNDIIKNILTKIK